MTTLFLLAGFLTLAYPPQAETCAPVDPASMIWTRQGYSIAMGDGHVNVLHEDVRYSDGPIRICIPARFGMVRLYLPKKQWVVSAHQKFAANSWIDKEVNKQGERCCDAGKDCHVVHPDRVMSHRDGVMLPDFNNVEIPGNQIQVSQDGQYWVCIWGGKVKCFHAPHSGS